MAERTVCINVKDDGAGAIIWSDPSADPDLDELIEYLIDEEEVTSPGTYVLMDLTTDEDKDPTVSVEDFALYTLTEDAKGRLEVAFGMTTPRVVKLTTWPPKK